MLDPGRQLPLAEPAAGAVRLNVRRFALVAAATWVVWIGAERAASGAESLVAPEDVSRTVVIQNLSVQGARVAGVIGNLSGRPVRDLRLQIVYSWLWADEHRQGTDDPSFVATELIPDEIPPHGQTTFGYSYPSGDTLRSDGRFIVDAKIIGYRVVSETRTTGQAVP